MLEHARDPQRPGPLASGFRDFDPFDRGWSLGTGHDAFLDALPVRIQVRSQVADRHPVHSWRCLPSLLNPLQCLTEVLPLQHLLQ